MSDSNSIVVNGKVTTVINSRTFKVLLENGVEIQAVVSGKIQHHHVNITLGDDVGVELSMYDLTKGRIIKRIDAFRPNQFLTNKKRR
jgi:translation initiation factor IF-1